MKRLTKDTRTYITVNIVLLIMAIVLISIFCLNYNNNKNDIVKTVSDQTNIIVETIEAEQEKAQEKTNSSANENIVLPTITQENENIQTKEYNNKYYYNQLNYNAKLIYDEVEKNVENMKTGTYPISLSNTVARTLDKENGMEILNQDFQSALDALTMDRVDLFYIDVSKISLRIKTITYGSSIKNYLTITPSEENGVYFETGINNENDVKNMLYQINSVRDQIISGLEGTQYNKILQIHNWLVNNLEYSTDNGACAYNIYGALALKKSVCEGYAESFKYIMDKIGVPCNLVSGTATNSEGKTENHEWNYVQMDGSWYAVDITWDDPILVGGGTLSRSEKYKYFLKGSETMEKNHFENGKFSSNGATFQYPILSTKDYNN